VSERGQRAARDPVCGMSVDPATARYRVDYDGAPVYFCSERCRTRFLASPTSGPTNAAAVAPSAAAPTRAHTAMSAVLYTCPMHPQIRREHSGSCPSCGMALEPVNAAAAAHNPELRDMTRRLWVGAVLAAPTFMLEMSTHFPLVGLHRYLSAHASGWIEFALGTPVVLWAGWPFFERAWASLLNRSLNMFSLIAVGVGAAYLYSLAATFLPGLFPPTLRHDGTLPVYYEAAAVIIVLVLLGQVLELRAREKTSDAIRALLKLAPKVAHRIGAGGQDEEVPLERV
jgi:Cu+-exporting ATPase